MDLIAVLGAITGPVSLVTAIITGWFVLANRRGGERAKARMMEPPEWPEVWAQMQIQNGKLEVAERQLQAAVRLLLQVTTQWPKTYDPPVLNVRDLEIIKDILPTDLSAEHRTEG